MPNATIIVEDLSVELLVEVLIYLPYRTLIACRLVRAYYVFFVTRRPD